LALVEGLQKRTGSLNTHELLQRAGFQDLVCVSSCDYLMQTH